METLGTAIKSIISYGADGIVVDIECHLANSLPGIVIVGAASRNVDESKERIRGAYSNAGLTLPRKRISINLAPADVPKDSSSLDLPIAVAILLADGYVSKDSLDLSTVAIIGELGLDGQVRPVRGIIGKLLAGRSAGITTFYIPTANKDQAKLVPGIRIIPLRSLRELCDHFAGQESLLPVCTSTDITPDSTILPQTPIALSEIVGQTQAKRAIEIAAAGGHNVLLSGPPGTGKSMLAKALASLLPPLNHEEMLEVTHLHSLTGQNYEKLVTSRPVRAPHHSASHVAIVGGGSSVRPGEVSLAHRGVLFFDELPEFQRPTVEALRQPLEDRTITVNRAKESVQFPADFIFVATANPCPCGYSGTTMSERCQCTAATIQRYRRKLSGPLLDRIDICVAVEAVDHTKLLASTPDNSTVTSIIRRVAEARHQQAIRFGGNTELNSSMDNRDIRQSAKLSPAAKALLDVASGKLRLSARAYMRTIRVARTIADLESAEVILPSHLTEALQYRSQQEQPL